MAKASGSTRTSTSRNPRGLNESSTRNGGGNLLANAEEAKRLTNRNYPEDAAAIDRATAQLSMYYDNRYSLNDLSMAYGSTFENRSSDSEFNEYRNFMRSQLGENTFRRMLENVNVSEESKRARTRLQSVRI